MSWWRIRGHEDEGNFGTEEQAVVQAWHLADHAVPRQMQRAEVYEWTPPPPPSAFTRGPNFRGGSLTEPVFDEVADWQRDLAASMGVHPSALAEAYLPAPPVDKKLGATVHLSRLDLDRDSRAVMDDARIMLLRRLQAELDKAGCEVAGEVEFQVVDEPGTYTVVLHAQCLARTRVVYPTPKPDWRA